MKRKSAKVIPIKDRKIQMMSISQIKAKGDAVIMEGFANVRVVDRGNDIFAPDAWLLENFRKNPVILFNHGLDAKLGSTPIGKVIEIRATDQGLFVKVELSRIDDPDINRIRGLVKERILKAFSVGFDPIEVDRDPETGVNVIKKAELFEISIVGVPMNQDSLFNVKSMINITGSMIQRRSVDSIKKHVLLKRGAHLAYELHSLIVSKSKPGTQREKLIDQVIKLSKLDETKLLDLLAGETKTVEDQALRGIAEALEVDFEDLKALIDDNIDEKPETPVQVAAENQKQAEEIPETPNEAIQAANTEEENNDFGNPMLAVMNQLLLVMGDIMKASQRTNELLESMVTPNEPEIAVVPQPSEDEDVKTSIPSEGKPKDDIVTAKRKANQLAIDNYVKRLENSGKFNDQELKNFSNA